MGSSCCGGLCVCGACSVRGCRSAGGDEGRTRRRRLAGVLVGGGRRGLRRGDIGGAQAPEGGRQAAAHSSARRAMVFPAQLVCGPPKRPRCITQPSPYLISYSRIKLICHNNNKDGARDSAAARLITISAPSSVRLQHALLAARASDEGRGLLAATRGIALEAQVVGHVPVDTVGARVRSIVAAGWHGHGGGAVAGGIGHRGDVLIRGVLGSQAFSVLSQ
jgi:hypothetical protein